MQTPRAGLTGSLLTLASPPPPPQLLVEGYQKGVCTRAWAPATCRGKPRGFPLPAGSPPRGGQPGASPPPRPGAWSPRSPSLPSEFAASAAPSLPRGLPSREWASRRRWAAGCSARAAPRAPPGPSGEAASRSGRQGFAGAAPSWARRGRRGSQGPGADLPGRADAPPPHAPPSRLSREAPAEPQALSAGGVVAPTAARAPASTDGPGGPARRPQPPSPLRPRGPLRGLHVPPFPRRAPARYRWRARGAERPGAAQAVTRAAAGVSRRRRREQMALKRPKSPPLALIYNQRQHAGPAPPPAPGLPCLLATPLGGGARPVA